ncbi:hypothetical protein HYFRA_00006228 [Hymenoscyphus fraxineus]|uniref:Uncharacterized protein n=1 Tax=Hymenoscyphus fraxineus TaxID=746836 RepID=A0A9N9Q020_9HELO|nr:hypothetical protein HYFRA_00006228 [Hymenoscyphus fraxineus]
MSTLKSLEDFHIPVRQIHACQIHTCQIHAPPEPKNKMLELIQVPLTPRTEAINREAIERLSAPTLGNKNVKAKAIIMEQNEHPYSKKLNSMYLRSVRFADRAAQRKEEWLAKKSRNADHKKNVPISKMEGDPQRPPTNLLETAMKENLQFDKFQSSKEDAKILNGEDNGGALFEVNSIPGVKGGLAQMIFDTRNFTPGWDELSYEMEKAKCV